MQILDEAKDLAQRKKLDYRQFKHLLESSNLIRLVCEEIKQSNPKIGLRQFYKESRKA
jgi:hypothetical protein